MLAVAELFSTSSRLIYGHSVGEFFEDFAAIGIFDCFVRTLHLHLVALDQAVVFANVEGDLQPPVTSATLPSTFWAAI